MTPKLSCIATAFYHTKGSAPNLRARSHPAKIDHYYQCMVVFFASIRKFHTNEMLVLFSNEEPPQRFVPLFEALGVHHELLDSDNIVFASDASIHNRFPGCLFTLDVINYYAASHYSIDCSCLLLFDSDCILRKDLTPLIEELSSRRSLAGIPLDYPVNHPLNGQTVASLTLLYEEYQTALHLGPIQYYGGEFFAMSSKLAEEFAHEIQKCFSLVKTQKKHYGNEYTEEHILSLVLNHLSEHLQPASDLIKRIWTADSYNNIEGCESSLSIFHLPAEKDKYFKQIYRKLEKNIAYLDKMPLEEYRNMTMIPIDKCLHPGVLSIAIRKAKQSVKRLFSDYICN